MPLTLVQDELDVYMESEEADYSKFSEGLAVKRRQVADEAAPAPTRSIGGTKHSFVALHVQFKRRRKNR